MKRHLLLAVCALALAACSGADNATPPADAAATGADGATPGAAAETAQAPPPRVSATPCESSQDFESVGRTETFYFYSDNDPLAATGIAVDAAPGTTTCTGQEFDVSCQVRGPTALVLTIQDSVMWRIPAGRTATLTNRGSDLTCFLNEPN